MSLSEVSGQGMVLATWSPRGDALYSLHDCTLSQVSNDHDVTLYCLLLFYAIATIFQLYHGGDMMYEMSRRKPEPTLLLTQGIFNLPWYERNWPLKTL